MQSENPELQFDRGHASFLIEIDATRCLGSAFDRYRELMEESSPSPPSTERAQSKASGKTSFHCGKVRALSEIQKSMLNWILLNQDSFVSDIARVVRSYYASAEWADWEPGDYSGRAAPPPTIPDGYALEDFIRMPAIFLNANACVFGVAVQTAWFDEGGLGLRFTDYVNSEIGEDSVALV